jgi:hypothetical protein
MEIADAFTHNAILKLQPRRGTELTCVSNRAP